MNPLPQTGSGRSRIWGSGWGRVATGGQGGGSSSGSAVGAVDTAGTALRGGGWLRGSAGSGGDAGLAQSLACLCTLHGRAAILCRNASEAARPEKTGSVKPFRHLHALWSFYSEPSIPVLQQKTG